MGGRFGVSAPKLYRLVYIARYANGSASPVLHRFLLAESFGDAEGELYGLETEPTDEMGRNFDIDAIERVRIFRDSRYIDQVGVVFYENDIFPFRGPAPALAFAEFLVKFQRGEARDLTNDDFDQLCEDAGLSPYDGEVIKYDWIRAFPGANGHGEHILKRIELYRSQGADVQCESPAKAE